MAATPFRDMMMYALFCPNCDLQVTYDEGYLCCANCSISWAVPLSHHLPTSPIGEEAREESFRRVWDNPER
jgi:hypothetical protein